MALPTRDGSSPAAATTATTEATPAPGSVARQIQITTEEIRRIANANMAAMEHNARQQSADLRNLSVGPAAFGSVPQAAKIGQMHQAAHAVFVSTLKGVITDLEEFASRLTSSAQSYDDADGAAAFEHMGTVYRDHAFHSDQRHDHGASDYAREHPQDAVRAQDAQPSEGPAADAAPAAVGAPEGGAGFEGDTPPAPTPPSR